MAFLRQVDDNVDPGEGNIRLFRREDLEKSIMADESPEKVARRAKTVNWSEIRKELRRRRRKGR